MTKVVEDGVEVLDVKPHVPPANEFDVTVVLRVRADNESIARVIVGEMLLPALDALIFPSANLIGVAQVFDEPSNEAATPTE